MPKFPVDAPRERVVNALQAPGFVPVRVAEHISMRRVNADGSVTPLTLPSHRTIKGSTLRAICTQAGIPREDFLRDYTLIVAIFAVRAWRRRRQATA